MMILNSIFYFSKFRDAKRKEGDALKSRFKTDIYREIKEIREK